MASAAHKPVRHRVRSTGHGEALLAYLTALIPVSESEVRAAIKQGRFRLEGGVVLGEESRLNAGQIILADVPDRSPKDPFLPPPPDILHEIYRDEHILAVYKPPGLLCHPMGTARLSAMSIAQDQLEREGQRTELRPLHRLDRETSGVLLMARTREADVAIKSMFEKRTVHKRYLALVHGHLKLESELVDEPIAPDDGPIRVRMRVHSRGKSAQTQLRVLEHFGSEEGFSWVEAIPFSGRTHQIRVHLAHLGHPVVGDKLYQGDGEAFLKKWHGELQLHDIEELGLPRHALHASLMSLEHPLTDSGQIELTAPTPSDLLEFATRMGSRSGAKELTSDSS